MGRYFWNILIWIDQGVNVILAPLLNILFAVADNSKFGDPDETLSSVLGKNAPSCKACKFMCKFLAMLDEKHCKKSIEMDEGGRSL